MKFSVFLCEFIYTFYFWLLKALQDFFGYEPCPGFHTAVQAKIGDEINEWKEKKQNLIS